MFHSVRNLLRFWSWTFALVLPLLVQPGVQFSCLTRLSAQETPPSAVQASAESTDSKQNRTQQLVLKYGDGRPDGKKSIAGAGEMIHFELPTESGKIRAIKVHSARYGNPQPPKEDVEVTLLSEDMTETLHTELVPYSLFKRLKKLRWTYVPFQVPVDVPKTFWLVLNFNAEQTKGVYVSYDTSTKGEYSRIGATEEDAREVDFGGDWMVQVLLAK